MKFFSKDAKGLKDDIERHREKEAEINARIAELEAQPEDMITTTTLIAYRRLRAKLLRSKAEVVNKIGKKNDN